MFGRTITAEVRGPYSYSTGTGFVGDKSASITITFTATHCQPRAGMGWSHRHPCRLGLRQLGRRNLWIAVPHGFSTSMDRVATRTVPLSADAVIFPASITIVKQTDPASDPRTSDSQPGAALTPSFFLDTTLRSTPTPTSSLAYTGLQHCHNLHLHRGPLNHWALSFRVHPCDVAVPMEEATSGTPQPHSTINLRRVKTSRARSSTLTRRTPSRSPRPYKRNHRVPRRPVAARWPPIGETCPRPATLTGATSDAGGTITLRLLHRRRCTQNAVSATPASNTVASGRRRTRRPRRSTRPGPSTGRPPTRVTPTTTTTPRSRARATRSWWSHRTRSRSPRR